MLYPEGHVGWFGLYSKILEEAGEEGVGNLVVDHKTGIDRVFGTFFGNIDGMGMATGPRLGLKEGNLGMRV